MTKQAKHNSAKKESQKKGKEEKPAFRSYDQERDIVLSRRDAMGGSPADVSVGGEEDAGVGLEFLVRKEEESR